MSETIHVTTGDKVRRGAVVVSGAADLEFADRKKAPTKFRAFHCPKGCIAPAGEDGKVAKRSAVFWVNTDHDEAAIRLTACYFCGESLVQKPKSKRWGGE